MFNCAARDPIRSSGSDLVHMHLYVWWMTYHEVPVLLVPSRITGTTFEFSDSRWTRERGDEYCGVYIPNYDFVNEVVFLLKRWLDAPWRLRICSEFEMCLNYCLKLYIFNWLVKLLKRIKSDNGVLDTPVRTHSTRVLMLVVGKFHIYSLSFNCDSCEYS